MKAEIFITEEFSKISFSNVTYMFWLLFFSKVSCNFYWRIFSLSILSFSIASSRSCFILSSSYFSRSILSNLSLSFIYLSYFYFSFWRRIFSFLYSSRALYFSIRSCLYRYLFYSFYFFSSYFSFFSSKLFTTPIAKFMLFITSSKSLFLSSCCALVLLWKLLLLA